MVESIMRMSYPAFSSGVAMARMPSGAVASTLEQDATKNTIFLDDFTEIYLRFHMVLWEFRRNLRSACRREGRRCRFRQEDPLLDNIGWHLADHLPPTFGGCGEHDS